LGAVGVVIAGRRHVDEDEAMGCIAGCDDRQRYQRLFLQAQPHRKRERDKFFD
jgi:hypothetical protein